MLIPYPRLNVTLEQSQSPRPPHLLATVESVEAHTMNAERLVILDQCAEARTIIQRTQTRIR